MKKLLAPGAREARESRRAPDAEPSFACGYLATLPLFLSYEIARALSSVENRNSAEIVVTLPLSICGLSAPWARVLLLALAAVLAARVAARRAKGREGAQLGRSVLVGILAGLVIGPALVLLASSLGGPGSAMQVPDGQSHGGRFRGGRPEAPPALPSVLRLLGAAGWEELLFRAGVYGILYLVLFRSTAFLGTPSAAARVVAELAAMLGSAVFFAAFHLEVVQRELGLAGEAFAPEVFLWRVLCGLALAGLFRWRGLGVASWAHGVLNLGLALGAGPGVFRSE